MHLHIEYNPNSSPLVRATLPPVDIYFEHLIVIEEELIL